MTIRICDLWTEMEREAISGSTDTTGWLLRLAQPEVRCPMFAAIDLASRRRALLITLPAQSVPLRQRWPRCKGLEPLTLKIDGKEYFGVALKEARFNDVFGALAEDLSRRVSEAITPDDQSGAFLGQLSRWQKFLTASLGGLSDQEQRGLWGELRFLRNHLLPVFGLSSVAAWKGPEHAHQDFQFEGGAIEVKTTLANQPQIVRITNERQLDESLWPTLILHITALDVRDGGGETLHNMVSSLRLQFGTDLALRERFEDCLLLAGYLDVHAGLYSDRGYLIRSETSMLVTQGFPMLVERGLPAGIGEVNYGLAIAACAAFTVDTDKLTKCLVDIASGIKQSNRSEDDES